jgi:hypothetical protein
MTINELTRAERYRQGARLVRGEAHAALNPDARRQLLEIAQRYERLADAIERRDADERIKRPDLVGA